MLLQGATNVTRPSAQGGGGHHSRRAEGASLGRGAPALHRAVLERQSASGGGGSAVGPPPPHPLSGGISRARRLAVVAWPVGFGGLELGSSAFDFRHKRWREVELSSWFDDDDVIVFIPVLLWDLAR